MSFFESSNSTNANTTSSSASEYCENCSSNFTIFKRKKTCHICQQEFCQACVNRHQVNTGSNSSNSSGSSKRICVICQSICLPQTTMEDLMKYKLKHLRSILNTANVATNTCKEKRDLAELVLRNRTRINHTNSNQSSRAQPQPGNNTNNQQQQQSSTASDGLNNTFSNFMNNVQDFVNFNLNSVANNAHPMPAGSSSSARTTTNSNPTNPTNNRNSSTRSSSSSSSSSVPGHNNTTYNNNSSNGRNTNAPAGSNNNLDGLFEMITEQVPNVFNQTFTNNQFTFNNLFPAGSGGSDSTPASTATTTETSNQSLNRNAQNTAQSSSNVNDQNSHSNASTTAAAAQQSQTSSSNASSTNLRRRASLSDIKAVADIESLTIKQIKEILACNFVDYKGCCEKKELVDKTKRLYASYLENKRLESEINETGVSVDNMAANGDGAEVSSASGAGSGADMGTEEQAQTKKKIDESDMCKICMECLIDCVLLDCGHMVSCIKCGKRLAECPMCRQNIVRVIRVFKS